MGWYLWSRFRVRMTHCLDICLTVLPLPETKVGGVPFGLGYQHLFDPAVLLFEVKAVDPVTPNFPLDSGPSGVGVELVHDAFGTGSVDDVEAGLDILKGFCIEKGKRQNSPKEEP